MAISFREYTNTRRGEANALSASPDENVDYDALAVAARQGRVIKRV
jgi:hypothetical protein